MQMHPAHQVLPSTSYNIHLLKVLQIKSSTLNTLKCQEFQDLELLLTLYEKTTYLFMYTKILGMLLC